MRHAAPRSQDARARTRLRPPARPVRSAQIRAAPAARLRCRPRATSISLRAFYFAVRAYAVVRPPRRRRVCILPYEWFYAVSPPAPVFFRGLAAVCPRRRRFLPRRLRSPRVRAAVALLPFGALCNARCKICCAPPPLLEARHARPRLPAPAPIYPARAFGANPRRAGRTPAGMSSLPICPPLSAPPFPPRLAKLRAGRSGFCPMPQGRYNPQDLSIQKKACGRARSNRVKILNLCEQAVIISCKYSAVNKMQRRFPPCLRHLTRTQRLCTALSRSSLYL